MRSMLRGGIRTRLRPNCRWRIVGRWLSIGGMDFLLLRTMSVDVSMKQITKIWDQRQGRGMGIGWLMRGEWGAKRRPVPSSECLSALIAFQSSLIVYEQLAIATTRGREFVRFSWCRERCSDLYRAKLASKTDKVDLDSSRWSSSP